MVGEFKYYLMPLHAAEGERSEESVGTERALSQMHMLSRLSRNSEIAGSVLVDVLHVRASLSGGSDPEESVRCWRCDE